MGQVRASFYERREVGLGRRDAIAERRLCRRVRRNSIRAAVIGATAACCQTLINR